MVEYTFSMIKPDAVNKGLVVDILKDIESNGFFIIKMRKFKMTKDQARRFYVSLKDLDFFEDLCDFMSSGDIVGLVLSKKGGNTVKAFRNLIGVTDPAKADSGTLRKKYGESKGRNAVHGSDSIESAQREVVFFEL